MNDKRVSNRRQILTAGMSRHPSDERDRKDRSASRLNQGDHQQSYLETYTINAMACQFEFLFNLHQYPNTAEVALQAFQLIAEFEQQMSIYRSDSEVSRINKIAHQGAVAVEPRLFGLLRFAVELHESTGGAFDMTSGLLSDLWGFSRRKGKVPNDDEIQFALESVSSSLIEFSGSNRVKFEKQGVHLNLGGIGKGFALDHAADLLANSGIEDFVMHGGQSSVVAHGQCLRDVETPNAAWKIGLSHPLFPVNRMAEINLVNSALGTSGTGRQGFFQAGKRYGHIIDPRTGRPTDHFLSSTVICHSAAKADALATAFFVMTLEEIQEYCDRCRDIKAILVVAGEDLYKPGIETFNLTEGDWNLAV